MYMKCHGIGNVTKKPEIREIETKNGPQSQATFSIAIYDGKDKNGEALTSFYNCITYGATAKYMERIDIGNKISIEGKCRIVKKDDKTYINVTVTEIESLTPRAEDNRVETRRETKKHDIYVDDKDSIPFN